MKFASFIAISLLLTQMSFAKSAGDWINQHDKDLISLDTKSYINNVPSYLEKSSLSEKMAKRVKYESNKMIERSVNLRKKSLMVIDEIGKNQNKATAMIGSLLSDTADHLQEHSLLTKAGIEGLSSLLTSIDRTLMKARVSESVKLPLMSKVSGLKRDVTSFREVEERYKSFMATAFQTNWYNTTVKSNQVDKMKLAAKIDSLENRLSRSQMGSFFNYAVMTLGLAGLGLAGFMAFKNRKLKIENEELENKDWGKVVSSRVKRSYETSLNELENISVARFDRAGRITFANDEFKSNFKKVEFHKLKWDEFFAKNFKKEKALRGQHNLYKFIGDVTCDYSVQTTVDKATGQTLCWLYKFDSILLTKIGSVRKASLDKLKVNSLDILDDLMAAQFNMSGKQYLDFADVGSANDLYIYAPVSSVKNIFDKALKAIIAIQDLKQNESLANVAISRKSKKFVLTAEIPGVSLDSSDFGSKVTVGSREWLLNDVIKGVEASTKDFNITTIVKNTRVNGKKVLVFEMTVADLEDVKWNSREFRV